MWAPSLLKKPVYCALIFFGTLGILSAGYAGFVTLQSSDADSGKSLTSGMMQSVIGNLADLDSRMLGISGDVGSLSSAVSGISTNLTSLSGAVSSLQASTSNLWGPVTGGIGYSGGKVGIGTTNPKGPLHIISPGTYYEVGSLLLWDYANTSVYAFINAGKNLWIGYNENSAGGYPQADYKTPLFIKSDGRIGIGTSNPVSVLEIVQNSPSGYSAISLSNTAAGGVRWSWLNGATGSPLGAGSMCFEQGGACRFRVDSNGAASAMSFTQLSDSRLKTSVTTTSGLETINKLRGVEFDWISWEGKSSGVIAQELETVLPHLVTTDESSKKIKTVNYSGLSAYFIEAIKELSRKIDKLFEKYIDQQKEIDELKIRLEKLEQK